MCVPIGVFFKAERFFFLLSLEISQITCDNVKISGNVARSLFNWSQLKLKHN